MVRWLFCLSQTVGSCGGQTERSCSSRVKGLRLILYYCCSVPPLFCNPNDGCRRAEPAYVRLEFFSLGLFSSFWLCAWQSVVISMTRSSPQGVCRRTHTVTHICACTHIHQPPIFLSFLYLSALFSLSISLSNTTILFPLSLLLPLDVTSLARHKESERRTL